MTGNLHSGKTTFVKGLVCELKKKGWEVVGVLSPAVFNDEGERIGYDLLLLDTGERLPFLRTWKLSELSVGPYSVNVTSLNYARIFLNKSLESEEFDMFVLDEIGYLELIGSGFNDVVENALRRGGRSLYVVRSFLLNQFIAKYGLEEADFTVVDVPSASLKEVLQKMEGQEDAR